MLIQSTGSMDSNNFPVAGILLILLMLATLLCGAGLAFGLLVYSFPALQTAFTAGVSAVFLAGGAWVCWRRRRVSMAAILLVIAGSLMVGSTSIQNSYDTSIRHLPDDIQDSVRRATDFRRLAAGLSSFSLGVVYMAIARVFAEFPRTRQEHGSGDKALRVFYLILNLIMAATHLADGGLKIFFANR